VLDPAALRARLAGVRERIARAAGRAGRDPASIRLVAVSKTFSADNVRAAADSGQLDFGENKVQEALQKMTETAELPLRWHLVGHLQSNKARKAAERFDVIHSVDGPELVTKLDEAAHAAGRHVDLLVQVDLAGETTKHGARPGDVPTIFSTAQGCRAVRVTGLMVMPAAAEDPELARPYFAALRRLRDELAERGVERSMLQDLSMGMSHDFEIAVEEGATLVRVGSAIFGERGLTGV
jgi:pyridoxal phosphate enzyme (YggS family)